MVYLVCIEPFEGPFGVVYGKGQVITDQVQVALLSIDHAFEFTKISASTYVPSPPPRGPTFFLLGF